jgi:hypothetical protein
VFRNANSEPARATTINIDNIDNLLDPSTTIDNQPFGRLDDNPSGQQPLWTTTVLDDNRFGRQPFWTTTSTLFDNYWRRQPSATLITTPADDNININIDGAATSGLYAGFRTVRSVRPQPHPITDC